MKVLKYIKNPLEILFLLDRKIKILHLLPDKAYLKLRFRVKLHKKLDLKNPKTFNEKLQWLKLYNRNPEYTKMVDKYEVKNYVADIIGEEYIIPTFGIYDKFEDINFDRLPKQFVIKCTHDSGGIVICRDKDKLNIEEAKNKIEKSLKNNYFYHGREWPYKSVKPRIIIEKYMFDKNFEELKDYKLFTFNGIPKIILVCSERSKELKETWFNDKFEKLDLMEGGHGVDSNLNRPRKLKEMIKLSEELSHNIPFVRVDFYEIGDRVYFGEMTFYPASGFEDFNPEKWNDIMGNFITLNIKNGE